MIRIECTCGKRLLVPPDYPEDRAPCPRCGEELQLRPPRTGARTGASGGASAATSAFSAPAARPTPSTPRPQPTPRRGGAAGWVALLAAMTVVPAVLALVNAASLKADNARLAGEIEKLRVQLSEEPRVMFKPVGGPDGHLQRASEVELERSRAMVEERLDGLERRLDRIGEGESGAATGVVAGGLETRLLAVGRRASPAVVALVTESGAGSGVVISTDGFILTNDHVVGGRERIEAHFPSGARYPARLLAKDEISDVALLRVDATNLTAMPFGDSDHLHVGQVVVALGNPFGLSRDGKPTMTLGIVSALHRIVTPGNGARRYGDAIQTDAAINPGNSGGALVDLRGRLVGINGAISSRTGSSAGIGFAIPVNFIKKILPGLKAGRSTEPGFLGIRTRELTADEQRRLGTIRGAVISSVISRVAATAGLRPGQLITHIDGQPVTSSIELVNRLSYCQAGETVKVGVLDAGGRTRVYPVTVGRRQSLGR